MTLLAIISIAILLVLVAGLAQVSSRHEKADAERAANGDEFYRALEQPRSTTRIDEIRRQQRRVESRNRHLRTGQELRPTSREEDFVDELYRVDGGGCWG